MLQLLKSAYRSLPPLMTSWTRYIPDRVLFGQGFREAEIRTDLGCLSGKLKATLDYARQHTAWGHSHIPTQIPIGDVEKILDDLPCVEAEELRAEADKFVSDEANRLNSYWTTTGETGKHPTSVCLQNKSYGIEWAHIMEVWGLGGYSRRKDCKLTFRGYSFRDLVRFDPIYNEVSVNPTLFAECAVEEFLGRISRYPITCIHGYPSLLIVFKEKLEAAGLSFNVREIMLGSEGASQGQKEELARFFNARIISWYGLTEKVVLAYDEFATNEFRVFTSYGHPRIINPDENGIGEIVGTTFVNPAMPLINYKTGDYGRLVQKDTGLYLVQLQGRSGKDFVWRDERMRYSVTAVTMPKEIQRQIVFYQVIQNEYGKVRILVMPRSEYRDRTMSICAAIWHASAEWLPGFEVEVLHTDSDRDFERSKRGKLRMLVQNLRVK